MEQPAGSIDDLQPQDLSTCSAVIDLTRKGEECVLNANSLEALHMVKSASWYPNTGNNKTALPFSETAPPDIRQQSGDPIQPDNAFSNTTVTLSYVSRSRVFSAHDSLSQNSPRYGVPSISKLSLHPSCEVEKGLEETGYGLSQHYLEQGDGPLDLAAQTKLFIATPDAHVGTESADAGVCVTQHAHKLNGDVSSDGDIDTHLKGKVESGMGLENGQDNSWSGSSVSPEASVTHAGVHEESVDSEVLFLVSRTQEPVVAEDCLSTRNLCIMSRAYISPLDPASPSATSLDGVEDVFILPQASSSPSADNSYPQVVDETASGLSSEGTVKPSLTATRSTSDSTPLLDTSNESRLPVHRRKTVLEPMIDLTEDGDLLSDPSEEKPKKEAAVPHINGNARTLQRTIKKKKLPARSGRGTRLEAIVLNINSNRYKVLDCVHTAKQTNTAQTSTSVINLASPKKKVHSFMGNNKVETIVPITVKSTQIKSTMTSPKIIKTKSINTDRCKESTSDSIIHNNSKNSPTSTPPKTPSPLSDVNESKKWQALSPQSSPRLAVRRTSRKKTEPNSNTLFSAASGPQFATQKKANKEPERDPSPHLSPELVVQISSPPKTPKKSPGKHKGKTSPAAKTKTSPPSKRRKKRVISQSLSMFAPKEPEIKLKYVHYKEEKRDLRLDTFSPFVHVKRKQSSPPTCTVINYPEEELPARDKKGQLHGPSSGFMSGAVPSTSCLQLGRSSAHSQHCGSLVCCLCGGSANSMDLGDLHGPYYPEGYRPASNTPASVTHGLKETEEGYSDSDSSSCSVRGRGATCALTPSTWPSSPCSPQQKALSGGHRWTSDGYPSGSPAAKRPRTEVKDWYSAPVVPLEPCEYWLHEDCGIWSAGVFLVKGRVYGLVEAVTVAQETMCSGCCNQGATLGCFFKGCPNKYHYRCALQSDCVLIEENFSMKCKKHKNKTFKAPPGNRWLDR